jgi:hypothetical protein
MNNRPAVFEVTKLAVRIRVRVITTVPYRRGIQAPEDASEALHRVGQVIKAYSKKTVTDGAFTIMVQANRRIST